MIQCKEPLTIPSKSHPLLSSLSHHHHPPLWQHTYLIQLYSSTTILQKLYKTYSQQSRGFCHKMSTPIYMYVMVQYVFIISTLITIPWFIKRMKCVMNSARLIQYFIQTTKITNRATEVSQVNTQKYTVIFCLSNIMWGACVGKGGGAGV